MNLDIKAQQIIEKAANDPNIVGIFYGGGRGKGFFTVNSDYDIVFVIKDGLKKIYEKKYKWTGEFDFPMYTESEFYTHDFAEWKMYSYAHVKAIVDKSGNVQKWLKKRAKIPQDERREYINRYLGGYLNSTYRSIKCWRDNNKFAARMEANRGIEHMLKALFCLHGGRSLPYYKHLKWDLETWPLEKIPLSSEELLKAVDRLMLKGDVEIISEMYRMCKKVFLKHGHTKQFTQWQEDMEKELKRV